MKRKKKKTIIYILLFLLTLSSIGLAFLIYYVKTNVFFYINDEKMTSYTTTIEYEENLSLSPEKIGLTAIQNKKDITDQLKVSKHNLTELKNYEINFYIEDNDLSIFPVKVKIVDTTPPKISGENSITITQNDTWDDSVLNLKAYDLFDKDLSEKIQCEDTIDTSLIGEQTLLYFVEDTNGNKSEFEVKVNVEEKEVVQTVINSANVVSNPDSIQVLLNKNYKLPDGWAPSDLTLIEGNHYLRYEAASSMVNMLIAMRNEGITVNIVSSYRSQVYQQNLYNSYMAKDPLNAPYYSAPSRSSEHELGLAVDLSYDTQLHSDLYLSSLGIWLENNAHKYGWILRYPSDKTYNTGYMFEAWHYRYVGVDLASTLKNSNLTLEEYYGV